MSLSEIIAGKRIIKRDAQMQGEYKGEKLHLGLYLIIFIFLYALLHLGLILCLLCVD